MNISRYVAVAALGLLLSSTPSFAAEHVGGADPHAGAAQKTDQKARQDHGQPGMGAGMMDPAMAKQHHEMMKETLQMLRDTMAILKDLSHTPTPDQKAKLEAMSTRLDEIIKKHDEEMKMMMDRREKQREDGKKK